SEIRDARIAERATDRIDGAEETLRRALGEHGAAGRRECSARIAGYEWQIEDLEELGVRVGRVESRLPFAGRDRHQPARTRSRQCFELGELGRELFEIALV